MNKHLKMLLDALAAKQAAKAKLLDDALSKGMTPDEETEKQISAIEADIKTIETNVARVEAEIKRLNAAANNAVPVQGNDPEGANNTTGKEPEQKPSTAATVKQLDKGIGFALAVKASVVAAKAAASGNPISAVDVLTSWGAPDAVKSLTVIKANVLSQGDANYGSALVQAQNLQNEFVELLRPATVLGRMNGFRAVPFNVKVPVQNSATAVQWVGEKGRKPATDIQFGSITINTSKIAGVVVVSDELVRFSSPQADALIRDDLVRSIGQFMDQSAMDPEITETTARPASLLNGVTAITATGTDAASYNADLLTAVNQLVALNLSLDGAYWVMSETRAAQMSTLRDALGNVYFAGMNVFNNQRTLMGIPVITSQSAGNRITLVRPSEILLADDGAVDFAISNEATIEIASNTSVNLFQDNLTGIRAERYIRWKKVRECVAYIQYA